MFHKERFYILFLALLILLAGIALIRGLNGDCPICSEADEYCYAPRGIYMALANTLNPGWFANPASTLVYPLEAYYKAIQLSSQANILNPAFTPEQMCAQNMAVLVKWPRLISVVANLATIPLVFLVGRFWLGNTSAVIGTSFYALCPMVIRLGQVLRTDPLANFFIYLFFAVLARLATSPASLKLATSAALIAGLAISTRYFGVALVVPLFAVMALAAIREKETAVRKKLILNATAFAALTALTFVVTSPYVFLNAKTAEQDLLFEQSSSFVGIATMDLFGNLGFYISEALPRTLGIPLTVLSLVGLTLALRLKDRFSWAILSYFFAYAAGVCINHRHWDRWLLPILPIICLSSGYALVSIYSFLRHLLKRKGRPAILETVAIVVVLLAVSSYPVRRLLAYDWQKRQLSAQAQGFVLLKDHVKYGDKIALDGAWDYPDRGKYQITTEIWRPDFIPPRPHNYYQPVDLKKAGFHYMLVQTWLRQFYQRAQTQFPREATFYNNLSKQAPLLFTTERTHEDSVFGIELEDRKTPVELYDLSALKTD